MRQRWFILLPVICLIVLLLNGAHAQAEADATAVVINEVMASNSGVIADENGDYSDWIELYNGGATAVDLTGYGFSDSYSQPFRWVFPAVTLEPGAFLLVWASGKNRTNPHAPCIPTLASAPPVKKFY